MAQEQSQFDLLESQEASVLSVSELNRDIKHIVESRFPLVWVRGEISNFKAHSSGHYYFSLKDDKSQVSAVMFRGHNAHLRFRLQDGLEVLARGRISVYEPRGNYQIYCEVLEPMGAGALQQAYEKLKKKLYEEGLYDPSRKKELPLWPRHLGVITSPTGAAIKDILNVLGRRFRGLQVTLIPALVQGAEAPRSLIAALESAQKISDIDVLIIGRGGGSIEDLWAFNEESLARAISACRLPIISAVGHEIDFTISDFVADVRAPTPSAAAELVIKNTQDVLENILSQQKTLLRIMQSYVIQKKETVKNLTLRLVDPQRKLEGLAQRSDELMNRLERAMRLFLKKATTQVDHYYERLPDPRDHIAHQKEIIKLKNEQLLRSQKKHFESIHHRFLNAVNVLESLSPLKVLGRGYSIVRDQNQKIIQDSEQVKLGDKVQIRLSRGGVEAQITSVHKGESYGL